MKGILNVTGISTFNSDVTMKGILNVTGISIFNSDVTMKGILTVSGNWLTVIGNGAGGNGAKTFLATFCFSMKSLYIFDFS